MLKRVTHLVCDDPDFLNVFCKIIKNPVFDYQPGKIEKEVKVRNYGDFQVIVDWQSPSICGIEIFKRTKD